MDMYWPLICHLLGIIQQFCLRTISDIWIHPAVLLAMLLLFLKALLTCLAVVLFLFLEGGGCLHYLARSALFLIFINLKNFFCFLALRKQNCLIFRTELFRYQCTSSLFCGQALLDFTALISLVRKRTRIQTMLPSCMGQALVF